MKDFIYHWTLIGLCFSLAACHNDEDILSPATPFSIHTTIGSYTSDSRATDAMGYEGIIKKEFVPQDRITVYTGHNTAQEKTYIATLQADGATWQWETGNPLLLPSETKQDEITATFSMPGQADDLVTSACQLKEGAITLHFMHRNALLSIQLWGNTNGPLSDIKLYDESDTAYPVTESMTLIPPQVRLCKITYTQDEEQQIVKFKPIEPLTSGISYKLNLHLDQIEEGGTATVNLIIQNITSWTDEGAYFNGKWYARDHIIATEDDLDALRNKINGNSSIRFKGEEIILISDLNFGGRAAWTSGINEFSGTFLGNGHTISNLFIETTATEASWYSSEGFISNLSTKGTIDNLHFKDSGINTQGITQRYKHYIGILTGTNNGTITRCSIINGNMRGARNTTDYTPGALAGMNTGKIIACHAKADIEIVLNGAGGLIGNNNNGTLFGCCYDGKIYHWPPKDSDHEIGLLIGYSRSNSSNTSVIRSCYGIKQTGSYEGRLLGKPNDYYQNPYYDKLEDLEKNCLLPANTAEGSKEALIKDAEDVTDANGIVWKAEKIWNDDLSINFDYHGEP